MSNTDQTGKFWASDDPEWYRIGPHATKEEAIEEYKAENEGVEPAHIGVSRAVYCDVDADDVLDAWEGGQGSELYEDALVYWCHDVSREKRDELGDRLTKVLHDWLDEVGEDKCWNIIEEISP